LCCGSPAPSNSAPVGVDVRHMSPVRRALAFAGVTFVVAGAWTALVWFTEIGASLYILPGKPFAEFLHPCELPQPFVPKNAATVEQAFGELVIEAMFRCGLPQGIVALKLSAAFWLLIAPLTVFLFVRFRRRSYA
jgi:hypothetical protein